MSDKNTSPEEQGKITRYSGMDGEPLEGGRFVTFDDYCLAIESRDAIIRERDKEIQALKKGLELWNENVAEIEGWKEVVRHQEEKIEGLEKELSNKELRPKAWAICCDCEKMQKKIETLEAALQKYDRRSLEQEKSIEKSAEMVRALEAEVAKLKNILGQRALMLGVVSTITSPEIDRIKALEQANAVLAEKTQLIRDIAVDYDGFCKVESLKELIDELREIAGEALAKAKAIVEGKQHG